MNLELSAEAKKIRSGRYLHFKGGEYQLIGVAHHSETLEELVVYQHIENLQIWVRPISVFIDEVRRDGYQGPRFKYLGE